MRDALIYLCYGQGGIVDETVFSLLSGLRHDPEPEHEVVVYTDGPERFEGLPVTIRFLTPERLATWSGPAGYVHRRKYQAVIDAIENSDGGRVVFVDGDTWFRKPPGALFHRVGPADSVLHVLENRLLDSGMDYNAELSAHVGAASLHDLQGRPFRIEPNARSWNSGVIGVHPDHLPWMHEASALLDELQSSAVRAHTLEQFVLGQVLERHTTVHEALDVVFHYWDQPLRRPFQVVLPQVLENSRGLPLAERAELLHAHRPRPRGTRRLVALASRTLHRTGLRRPHIRSSS